MKGLLAKDFRLLLSQKAYYMAVFLVAIVLATSTGSPNFVVGYLAMLCMMFALSSISYDEFDNGNAFLFCLPISRNGYVREKYLFAFLLGTGSWLLSFVVAVVCQMIQTGECLFLDLFVESAMIVLFFQVLISFMLPIQFKFGSEKGRMVQLAVYGVAFGAVFLGAKLLEDLNLNIGEMFSGFVENYMVLFFAVVIAAAILLQLLSMKISERIVEKKEF